MAPCRLFHVDSCPPRQPEGPPREVHPANQDETICDAVRPATGLLRIEGKDAPSGRRAESIFIPRGTNQLTITSGLAIELFAHCHSSPSAGFPSGFSFADMAEGHSAPKDSHGPAVRKVRKASPLQTYNLTFKTTVRPLDI